MERPATLRRGRFLVIAGAIGLLAAAVWTSGTLPAGADDAHSAGRSPDVALLTGRSAPPDDVGAQLRLRLDGTGPTHVMNMKETDNLVLAELTFDPGELVDWHTHPGPVIVIVEEGVLTVTTARDCEARDYGPQQVYVEQGPGDVLRVENATSEQTVIYALFFQVPPEGPLTIPEDDPGC